MRPWPNGQGWDVGETAEVVKVNDGLQVRLITEDGKIKSLFIPDPNCDPGRRAFVSGVRPAASSTAFVATAAMAATQRNQGRAMPLTRRDRGEQAAGADLAPHPARLADAPAGFS
jgi:hypothetical protein